MIKYCQIIFSGGFIVGKKESNLKTYIPGAIAFVLGIAAFCMMFLPAVQYSATALNTTKNLYSYTGSQLAFGYSESVLASSITILNFNFLIFLSFLLPVVGGVFGLIGGKSFIFKIVATACFVGGAVLLFTTAASATIGMTDTQKELVSKLDASLMAGPIVAAVLCVLGAVVCFFKKTIAKLLG